MANVTGAAQAQEIPEVIWPMITDVLDLLEAHGFRKADNQHSGQAVGMIGKLAQVYVGGDE